MLDDTSRLPNDAIAAVYVSSQSHDTKLNGYVLLISRNGNISAYQTSGMDIGTLVWDSNGLFFSDTEYDYRLADTGLSKWPSPKTDVQVTNHPLPNGVGYVGLYNLGYLGPDEELGYVEQVVETTSGGARRYDVAGYSTATAWCDSTLFSISEVVKPYEMIAQEMGATWRELPPNWPDMLTRVYPGPPTNEDGIVSIRANGYGGYARNSICRNDTIIAITTDQGTPARVVSWPTDGQDPAEQLLTDPTGNSLALERAIVGLASLAEWSVSGDTLNWYGGDGILRSTDITTGATVAIWDSEPVVELYRSSDVAFTFCGSTLFILEPTSRDASADQPMRLRSYNLDTQAHQEILTTSLGYASHDHNLVLRGFAIRP